MEQGIYNIVVYDEVELLNERIRKATGSLGTSKRDALNLLGKKKAVRLHLNRIIDLLSKKLRLFLQKDIVEIEADDEFEDNVFKKLLKSVKKGISFIRIWVYD